MIGMSLSHCTGGINGVGMGLSRVRVELLTPVTAACFDVYFNVVLCCSLFVYILIKKKHNKLYFTPSDARGIKSFYFYPKHRKQKTALPPFPSSFSVLILVDCTGVASPRNIPPSPPHHHPAAQ